MKDELSIIAENNKIDLEKNSDKKTALIKGTIGMVPVFGSLLAEIVGLNIENQKVERLQAFAGALGEQIKYLDYEMISVKMKTEEFIDLFEASLHQAANSMSDERRNYIALLLKNSLTNEELSHAEERKLLDLLGQLNDPEIIVLKAESLGGDEFFSFREKHRDILVPVKATFGIDREFLVKEAFQKSYRNKLMEIGLLEPIFKRTRKGESPEFDIATGRIKATSYKVSSLGQLLLQYINDGEENNEG